MNYLVTGATGGFGGYALDYLKKAVPLENIYALARSEEKASQLRAEGIKVRIADYSDLTAMKAALKDIDRLLFVSGAPKDRQADHKNVVEAAKAEGVSYIVYTSFTNAKKSTSELATDHIYTEKLIEQSGITHTFVRNNWYLENELPIIDAALNGGKFIHAAGNGKTGWALKREYAEAAVKVLVKGDYPKILEFAGTPVSYEVLADALETVAAKGFEVIDAGDQDFVFVDNLVAQGFPEPVANIILSFETDIIKANQLDIMSADLEEVLDRPLVSLETGLKEILA